MVRGSPQDARGGVAMGRERENDNPNLRAGYKPDPEFE